MFTSVRPATAADVIEFAAWRYEPPYDVYDLTEPVDEAVAYFTSPSTGCHVVHTADGLAGYCTFGEDARVPGGDYASPAIDIGAALAPSLTGKGHGSAFVAAILAFAAEEHGPVTARVTIAAENGRAIRVWEENGFTEVARFRSEREVLGTREFVILERSLA